VDEGGGLVVEPQEGDQEAEAAEGVADGSAEAAAAAAAAAAAEKVAKAKVVVPLREGGVVRVKFRDGRLYR
jgi:hypothetical protein